MAAPTYGVRGIVVRKTKLGESDLICTLVAQDGSQVRAVAKGARKPNSSFSSRLELYSVVDLLCAQGRNLDIVKEARLVSAHDGLRMSVERSAAAACIAELLERLTQPKLPCDRLFDCSCAALDCVERCVIDSLPFVCASQLLKSLAFEGLRPSLRVCAACGCDVDAAQGEGIARFSVHDGGLMCPDCARVAQTTPVGAATLSWAYLGLSSTFTQIEHSGATVQIGIDCMQLCLAWIRAHVGYDLKSARFLLTAGLF